MATHVADDDRFAHLCRGGALERIEIRAGHARTPMPLTASGHVLDAELGDVALRLRYGFEDEHSLEPCSRDDLESGPQRWVGVDGAEAPLLADDASSILGYVEFPRLRSDLTRELVNESIQALYLVWTAAAARRAADRSRGIPLAESLRHLNGIAEEAGPIGAWEADMKEVLGLGHELSGAVSDLRFEPPHGLATPRHFHEVNASMHFTPAGGEDSSDIAVVWRDAGGGHAAVELRLGGLPDNAARTGRCWNAVQGFYGPARTEAIETAAEWLAAVESGAHEFVFAQTFDVIQRIAAATRAGQPPGDDQVVWNRCEGTRRSALAHLNLWVREVCPLWAGPPAGSLRPDREPTTSDWQL
jgi:hypothetical protein